MGMSDWHRRRVEAAAEALARAEAGANHLSRAELVLRAADGAVGGIVPVEEYQQLALDYSAWRVRAFQDEDLLERTLETLDRIEASPEEVPAEVRHSAFVTAVEVRAMLDARRDAQDDEPA
jgi:hypothetical protein